MLERLNNYFDDPTKLFLDTLAKKKYTVNFVKISNARSI